MKTQILRLLLFLLGTTAVGIGLSIIGFGPDKTVQLFARIVETFGGGKAPVTGFNSVNVDSEFRFFAVFWVVYGGFLVQASHDLNKYSPRIPLLLALFFLGGLARAISFMVMGTPHTLFIVLMGVELILPVIMYLFWRGSQQS
ncbi:MAG: DUF4345 domain-containing protein [Robiginitomaculum sp.]|nr:DUF4345 domain-containing protein [Robiginitomaculum sp.]